MSEAVHEIKQKIRQRFVHVARSPHEGQPYPIGPDSAKNLGYDTAEIDALPAQVTESFAGVGNPLALGDLSAGESVLDFGCGAGLDSLLAARRIGPTGRVFGVDSTEEMVAKAKVNAKSINAANAEFQTCEADNLPVRDASVDVVISNGVFNLCLDKPKVLAEIHRVLKPGGRIQMADILLDDAATAEQVARKGAWSN